MQRDEDVSEYQHAPVDSESTRYLYTECVPRIDVDNPSLWWVGARFMRAFSRNQDLEQRIAQVAASVRELPTVRVAMADAGLANPPLHVSAGDFATSQDMLDLALLTSEVLHHLRSAVDYLVYNVAWADSGQRQEKTQFPVCGKKSIFDGKGVQNQMRGLTATHKSWIETVQPFHDVKWASELATLSNTDKHRFALETAPSLRFRVDLHAASPDPEDPMMANLPVDQTQLVCRVVPSQGPYRDVLDIFGEIFRGSADLINKFFGEVGLSPLQVGVSPNA
jgi:hypothetical protein